jgi:hypothetical protein
MQERSQQRIPLFGSKYEPVNLTFEDITYERDEREVPVWTGTIYKFERKIRAYTDIKKWPKDLDPRPHYLRKP